MMDRRGFLVAAGAASLFGFDLASAKVAKAVAAASPVGFRVPAGVVDSHCHVFDPARFAYSPKRRYTPSAATVADLRRFHASIGVQRTVVVQPSVYGTDNACLLDALRQFGASARGIAVIDKSFSGQQIDDLIGAGVRGVRINLEVGQNHDVEGAYRRLSETVETLRGRPAVIQIFAALPVIQALAPRIQAQPHPVVLDHFGFAKAAQGVGQAGFSALNGLMASGKVFVKLSAPYRISERAPYSDTAPIGRVLVEAAPTQVIWGTDWPHTGATERRGDATPTDIEPFREEDEVRDFSLVKAWAQNEGTRRKLLVENPVRLFGFSTEA